MGLLKVILDGLDANLDIRHGGCRGGERGGREILLICLASHLYNKIKNEKLSLSFLVVRDLIMQLKCLCYIPAYLVFAEDGVNVRTS